MGRRKQIRPHRSGGLLERQSSEAELNQDNEAQPQKDVLVDIEKPFYVEVDRSSWVSEEHYDVSEIVLLNLRVSEEFYGYKLTEEFYRDSRCFLRFRLSNVNAHLGRMKLGHWPVLSESNTCLQFGMKCTAEDSERDVVMVSGTVDGTDEGVTGLVHLVSLKYLTVRPILGIEFLEGTSSICIRVEILNSAFDECETLLDNTRQLWKKSMINVMAWLRPEVMTSEARYGHNAVNNMDVDAPVVADGDSSGSRQQVRFKVSSFYEAIKPSKEAPMLEDHLPDLLPELRPYQRRAAYWMLQRERGDFEHLGGNESSQIVSPLCMPLNLIDTSRRIYYNPFSGNVSLHASCCTSYVSGGILADEMGLGKTIELLSCIFAHRMPSSEVPDGSYKAMQVEKSQMNNLKRLKKERVECLCGAVTESYKYKGLWVQCDICDAWQHADCVGYSVKRKTLRSEEVARREKFEEHSIGNSRKRKKRRNDTKVLEMDGEYICQTCLELIQVTESPIGAGATLIVCPTPILLQWHAEILRHTKPGSLRICVYGGVRHTSFTDEPVTDINELLSADIVLTTYDVLKADLPHDSERHEGDRRNMRYKKRYPVVPTLLTRIFWWRICLDEAQMVEGNAATATELALRLHAKHRWCITGTPIQRKLDDLYGLLRFLQSSPFDVFRWWTDVISNPYERGDAGAMAFTHNFFKQLMWRSSKAHVWDELQLPPQEECLSWLSLSPIEDHFYQRQHETCVDDAREVVESFKDDVQKKKEAGSMSSDTSSGPYITNTEAAKLFNSLLKLRQACCHPQVGSSGLRTLQKSPMTMEEILSVLIGKTKVEGEEALRKLVVALNGLAGIAIIKQDFPQAILLYKEALDLVEEHSDDFRLDPLLNMHIHHNLAEALPLCQNSLQQKSISGSSEKLLSMACDINEKESDAMQGEKIVKYDSSSNIISDSSLNLPSCLLRNGETSSDVQPNISTYVQCLKGVCEDLKQKFLSVFTSKLSLAQLDFRKSYEQVCDAFLKRKNQHTTWWLEALHQIEQNKDSSDVLIQKIGEALSGNLNKKSRIPASFRSITSLKYYIQTGLDALECSRKTLIDRILEIDQTMENPREEDIARVRYCRKCNSNYDGPACAHCELDELFQVYEARLFRLNKSSNGEVIISAEEAVNLQKKSSALNQFYWNLSREYKSSTMSTSDYKDHGKKRDVVEKVTVSKSPSDLEIVLTIIRNSSRGLLERESISAARKQLDLLEALRKEYALARSLAIAQAQVLRAHDEIKMATSRLRLRENDNDKSIDALSPEELDIASVENSSEKFLALRLLSRVRGQLRYLEGLVQSNQNMKSESVDISTVAEGAEQLGNQKMVFQCGHVTCCKCLFSMTERRLVTPGKFHDNNNRVVCPTCRQHTDFRNIAFVDDRQDEPGTSYDKSEASITVQGSYSTKIEAVTRRILWINSTDPTAKILVFSSWNDVLDVLQHAFTANGISHIRMKGGRKSQLAISQFRGEVNYSKESNKKPEKKTDAKSPQVLLLLIQHGANGLNLLEAQHVILVEPLLNPAAEAQAVGRVHRIGQQHKTLVHRFIVKNTVEESIYKLNKSRNTSSFISGNRKNQDQPCLTLSDVESLFRVAPGAITEDQKPTGSLRDLPASVAAAIAAERRIMDTEK
ncbi:DEAD box-containing helicase-like transcription factor/DNA repair protein [Handroanthus impetiginosus]|uniref:DEAD box-containing helicase-like transcription factor/DNA repair protein n=1 Tax=Handroanthus impetiginosus TaxID=429701 RepID=A0A2G9I502_9LAMI|nr:DEAD box-containing helicase-like transcription factor/DNA repair protein [Handroanthus impetiginosus]